MLHSDESSSLADDKQDQVGKSRSVLTFINFALGQSSNGEGPKLNGKAAEGIVKQGESKGTLIEPIDDDYKSSLDKEGESRTKKNSEGLESLMNVRKNREAEEPGSPDERWNRKVDEYRVEEEEDEEPDEELVETALTLLLALLEGE